MPSLSPADLYPERGNRSPYTLLDVRAPVEIAAGALPFAVAQPILTDDERQRLTDASA